MHVSLSCVESMLSRTPYHAQMIACAVIAKMHGIQQAWSIGVCIFWQHGQLGALYVHRMYMSDMP